MSAEDKALTQKIFREYSEYLDKAGVPYKNDQNGFYVFIPLQNIEESFTQVCESSNGKIHLWDYCGNCYTGVRLAKRVAKAIQAQCPGYEIEVEHYTSLFELDIYHEVEYTTAEELHQQVLGVAHAVDVGVGIGKEMLGKDFRR